MKYTIVQFLSLPELINAVNAHLERGWRPLGGMRTINQTQRIEGALNDIIGYHQTLVLSEKSSEDFPNTDMIDEILFGDMYRKIQEERDRQAAVPELIEAAERMVDLVEAWMNSPRFEGVTWKSPDDHPPALKAMRKALDKVKTGG